MARRKAAQKVETIEEVPTRFIPCRSFRHTNQSHLNDRIITGRYKRVVMFIRFMVCNDCGTEIEYYIEVPSFRTIKARYQHPDGYLVSGGSSPREARAEYLSRLGYKYDKNSAPAD